MSGRVRLKMRSERSWPGLVVVLSLLAAACGGSGATDVEGASEVLAAEESATTTIEPVPSSVTTEAPSTTTTTVDAATETSADELATEEFERVREAMPLHGDPCASRLPEGTHEFSTLVEDQGVVSEASIEVTVDAFSAASEQPGLYLDLLAPIGLGSALPDTSEQGGGVTVVRARPDLNPGQSFWSSTETFNTNAIEAIWADLSESLCFDREAVVFGSLGQGNLVAVRAICETDIQISLAVLGMGMPVLRECAPTRAVPVVSYLAYENRVGQGMYWDGPWTPPVDHIAVNFQMDGGPSNFETWAGIYGCLGPLTEQLLPDPDDKLERDTTLLLHNDCDAPIASFGMQNNPGEAPGIEPEAIANSFVRMIELVDQFMDSNN